MGYQSINKVYLYFGVLIGAAVSLTGCATVGSINQKVETIVREDGIDRMEATLLAQQQILNTFLYKDYQWRRPIVLENVLVNDYPQYWFISFPANDFDQSFWHYLVVLDRRDGEIQYANEYVPLKVFDYDWVFQPSDESK